MSDAGQRVQSATHAFGLCLVVHMGGTPEARDCCACRKELCPSCKATPRSRSTFSGVQSATSFDTE